MKMTFTGEQLSVLYGALKQAGGRSRNVADK